MRLIDADKLHPDRMTNRGTVAISQSQIANAPSVPAIPISVIEQIKAEIKSLKADFDKFDDWRKKDGLYYALEIIDRHLKEYTE